MQFTINQRHFTWSRNACVPNDQWFAPDDDRWRLCIDYRFWSSPITTLAANNKPMEFRVQSSFLLGKSAKAILKVKLQRKNFLHIFLAPFPIKSRIPFKSLRKKYAHHCFMFKRLYVKAICHHGMSSGAIFRKTVAKVGWKLLMDDFRLVRPGETIWVTETICSAFLSSQLSSKKNLRVFSKVSSWFKSKFNPNPFLWTFLQNSDFNNTTEKSQHNRLDEGYQEQSLCANKNLIQFIWVFNVQRGRLI